MMVYVNDKGKAGRTAARSGFTLIELIAVMGIMATLSVIVVGSYTGIMRAISRSAGVNSLYNSLTLCRQYATVNGKDTYIWITDVDKYVLCYKAGKVSKSSDAPLAATAAPTYFLNNPDNPEDGGIATERARFVGDDDADPVGSMFGSMTTDNVEDMVDRLMGKKGYISAGNYLAFDFTDEAMARVVYPPWYDLTGGRMTFGLRGLQFTEGAGFKDMPESGAFAVGNEYGWVLEPERELPEGWMFKDENYSVDSTGKFLKANTHLCFKPDGSLGASGASQLLIWEPATKRGESGDMGVEVDITGKITKKMSP